MPPGIAWRHFHGRGCQSSFDISQGYREIQVPPSPWTRSRCLPVVLGGILDDPLPRVAFLIPPGHRSGRSREVFGSQVVSLRVLRELKSSA